ncbi:uncharacterized protein LOC142646323 [Dermatophagoides pteronyssinus]|uniref:uncharacterized protein LOC142646323 n=1 Tax=Dermatophagoides pteronyssinus TaxID=6956 RepID=UPI003F67F9D9
MRKNYGHEQINKDDEQQFNVKMYKYPYMAAFVEKNSMKADCAGIVIGNGEILVTGICKDKMAKNPTNYLVYIGHESWNNVQEDMDQRFIFKIDKIIFHFNNKSVKHISYYDVGIVMTNLKNMPIPIQRALLWNDDYKAKKIKNCHLLGFWNNQRVLVKIDVSIKEPDYKCLEQYSGIRQNDFYCLEYHVNCKNWNGIFIGVLMCTIEINFNEINVTLAMARFAVLPCDTKPDIVDIFKTEKISTYEGWIKTNVETVLFFDPKSLTPTTRKMTTRTTTTMKKTRKKTPIINRIKTTSEKNFITSKIDQKSQKIRMMTTTKQEILHKKESIESKSKSVWNTKHIFDLIQLDRINWFPCVVFLILMIMAISIFALFEYAYV